MLLTLFVLLALVSAAVRVDSVANPQPSGKRDVLLWQVQLTPDQCPRDRPCLNIYAVNQSQGDLLWYAYTTASSAVKAMSVGWHSVYYTTWSGPGLYTVNAATGHVRWQFPLDNWFRYWVKDIDLPPSASFTYAEEVRDLVYVTAAGPPSRLYGLKTKTGARQWEFKCPIATATLSDLAGPLRSKDSKEKTVFLAYNNPSNNSSWLHAVDIVKGKSIWQTEFLNETQIDRVEMFDSGQLLATSPAGDSIMSFNSSDGALVWQQQVQYCSTPSPIADVRSGELLLPGSCSSLRDMMLLDAYNGKQLWGSWQVPEDAVPTGNCTWVTVKDGSIFFGCSCNITGRGRHTGPPGQARSAAYQQQHQHQQHQLEPDFKAVDPRSSSMRKLSAGTAAKQEPGICMYAVSTHSGKLQWAQVITGDLSFPADAQSWGMAPMVHQGLAIFMASDRVYAVDSCSGKLSWTFKLESGDTLTAWQLPVLDYDSKVLVLTAQRPNKTAVTAIGFSNGKLMWRKLMNGTAQPPRGLVAGAEQLWLSGGAVYVEACRGQTCCLRALNVTTGKQKWGMCLQAERGEDATHPHGQFAIWIITVVTIGSIALLIVGACLLYVHRWTEERCILHGANGDGSPRHTYRPLPDRAAGSDSDQEDQVDRYQGLPQVPSRPPLPPVTHLPAAAIYQRPVVEIGSDGAAAAGVQAAPADGAIDPDLQQQQQQPFAGVVRVGGPREGQGSQPSSLGR